MTIQRIIELLEIEHECILRNSHDDCDRNCADCDLVQDDEELHEMYTDALALLKEQEAKEQISDAIHETAKQFRQTIVWCKDCIFDSKCKDRPLKALNDPYWYCAGGIRKDGDGE